MQTSDKTFENTQKTNIIHTNTFSKQTDKTKAVNLFIINTQPPFITPNKIPKKHHQPFQNPLPKSHQTPSKPRKNAILPPHRTNPTF